MRILLAEVAPIISQKKYLRFIICQRFKQRNSNSNILEKELFLSKLSISFYSQPDSHISQSNIIRLVIKLCYPKELNDATGVDTSNLLLDEVSLL